MGKEIEKNELVRREMRDKERVAKVREEKIDKSKKKDKR